MRPRRRARTAIPGRAEAVATLGASPSAPAGALSQPGARDDVGGEPVHEPARVGVGDDHREGRRLGRRSGPGQRRRDVLTVAGVPGGDLPALAERRAPDRDHWGTSWGWTCFFF